MEPMENKGKVAENIGKTELSIEELRAKLMEVTAEFRKKQDELNSQIYLQGKDEFADVSLEKLLVEGEALHVGNIQNIKFTLKTMTKAETLHVDKLSKKYIGESMDYYNSAVQVDTLAFALREYNGNKSPELLLGDKDFETQFNKAREAVQSLSDVATEKIFFIYSKLNRWIRSALEINFKSL